MGFRKMHSNRVVLVLNLFNGLIPPQYNVVFDNMFSTVVSSTASNTEVWIRLVTSRNSRIQVMLDQEDDLELDNAWLNANERLTHLNEYRGWIVGRVKILESPYLQRHQYSD